MEKFRGCTAHKDGGWVATIGVDGKGIYLGWFRTHQEAVNARIQGEIEHFGAVFDRREIEVMDDHARIPLHGRAGKFYGYALVDIGDLEIVRGISWTRDPRGYVVGRPAGHGGSVTMHRLIIHGLDKSGGCTDHKDGNRLDNRRCNLRSCTNKENTRNTRIAKNNSTGFKGIRKTKNGRWNARITANMKEIHIGNYATMEEAAAAYDAASLIHHLDFASPNSIVTPLSKAGSN
jgi:hypothetical protein